MAFDPRTMAQPVYKALSELRHRTADDTRLREQKSQAVELYTYLATWGLMRLKAEEAALSQEGKKEVVKAFFRALEETAHVKNLADDKGLETLKNLDTESYLGLTGLGLQIAREFSFWTTALYVGIGNAD
ncbi:hypothetical protein RHP47_00465 [Thermosynechococcus sp. QKsg1]|uniref:hypothetical protein n=1 Tax=unclassified Thermosynechococcus TaxID=2622553 RepID=UPI00257669B5|nr:MULTISPECIES: hypothetical protein [unclassified Thermosynechococcus]WJI24185.1 hypothetical protein MZ909_00485 [Thermosynechococcus sp. B0]WNC86819.1 hypothetical protein RHP47_00465 [Thermosynechococcus sp. QKsg1]